MRRPSLILLAALAFGVAAGCSSTTTDPADLFPTVMQAVSPTTVTAQVGTQVTVKVRILNAKGAGLANLPVNWTPTEGNVVPATSRTDAAGETSTVWTLGNQVGQQTLTATAQFVQAVTFSANATQ